MGLLDAFADPQFRKDVVRGLLDAGNRGAVAGLLGGPVDLATMALRPLGYNVEQPVGGSEWIGQKMQNLGLVSEKRNPLAEGLAAFAGPMVAQQIAPKVFAAELRAMENMAKPSPMNAATRGQAGAIVWHGSPHKFDKFDSSKIGTGEGAQAYGHGLYLAESPDTASYYKAALTDRFPAKLDGKQSAELSAAQKSALGILNDYGGNVDGALAFAKRDMAKAGNAGADFHVERYNTLFDIKRGRSTADVASPSLYKVDLPDDQIARMLDWDKPLSQQNKSAIDALHNAGLVDFSRNIGPKPSGEIGDLGWTKNVQSMSAEDLYRKATEGAFSNEMFLQGAKKGAAQAVISDRLRNAGIPGIRYLDSGSRGAGTGTSNYVVFPGNEDLLRILERNGVPLP